MASRVSFSGENLSLEDAADFYRDTESALKQYYSSASPTFEFRFIGYSEHAVEAELTLRLAELDLNCTLTILAALEARFRIDYEIRRLRRKKDMVSSGFRTLYARRGRRASLDEDILGVWQNSITGNETVIGDLRSAFKFRHWMAHGRYWTPKFGRRLDYLAAYALAERTLASFPLLSGD